MRRHNILLLWKEANLCARPRVAVGGKLWQCGLGCPCWRASCWGHSHLCDSGVLLLEILIQAPGGTLPSILNLVFFRAPGRDFPGGSDNQNLPTMQETGVQPVGQEDPREKEMTVSTPVLLPGEFYGQRNLADSSTELGMTELLTLFRTPRNIWEVQHPSLPVVVK